MRSWCSRRVYEWLVGRGEAWYSDCSCTHVYFSLISGPAEQCFARRHLLAVYSQSHLLRLTATTFKVHACLTDHHNTVHPRVRRSGMGKITEKQLAAAEKQFLKFESMINSMTPQERQNPDVLATSPSRRCMRVARAHTCALH